MNKNIYKNERLRATFGEIEVYNPNKTEKTAIQLHLKEQTKEMVSKITNKLSELKKDKDSEIDTDEFFKIIQEVSLEMTEKSNRVIEVDFMEMLTNVPREILQDEEIWESPSDDLEDAVDEVNRIVGRYLKKETEDFNRLLEMSLVKK